MENNRIISNNHTDLYYQGEVSFNIKIGGKFYTVEHHNIGLNYLKYIFANVLVGNYIEDDGGHKLVKPEMIDLRRKYYNTLTQKWEYISILRYKIEFTSKKVIPQQYYAEQGEDISDWAAEFTAVIPFESLTDLINLDDTNQYYFFIQSEKDKEHFNKRYDLASVPISVSSLSKITPGTIATIVWRMSVINPSEEEDNG